ncbi:16S rRNA (uracil(1498)-N(3))-methyltransferase [Halomonas sediminis]
MNLILIDPNELASPTSARITDPRRLRHLHEVHRAQEGDRLSVGIRGGKMGKAILSKLDEHQACFALESLDEPAPVALPVHLVLALPRPRMLARTLEHVTALGVKQLTLLNTQRVEKSYWQSPELRDDKIHQHLLLGLEQARDTQLPSIQLAKGFRPFLEDSLPGLLQARQGLLAHPGMPRPCPRGVTQPSLLLVGPEGGFIPWEVEQLLTAGCEGIHLGPRILRVETAVTALLARIF